MSLLRDVAIAATSCISFKLSCYNEYKSYLREM